MSRKPKQRNPMFWIKTIGWVIGIIVAIFIGYSVYDYLYSDISTSGLEICDEQGCKITMHWHAELEEMSVCGEIVKRPWEEGNLAGAHTHKDDRTHLHTLLRIDPETKVLIDQEPITLGGFFNAIDWQFSERCFKDTCDTCDGKPASTQVWKNGELLPSPFPRLIIEDGQQKIIDGTIRDYAWGDGDRIVIKFE